MTVFAPHCLAGQTCLVTGASSGIGRAAAILLATLGARVIVSGRDEARLESTLLELPGAGHAASGATLTDADATAQWVTGLAETHGPFTGIFHAAGVEFIRPVKLIKQEHLEHVFASSLYAAFGVARAASRKGVVADRSAIVFMSSAAGSTGQAGMTAYSAAKAGIDGLTRSLACELAPRGIRVNSIAAGAVATEMHARIAATNSAESMLAYEQCHPLGLGQPEDVANAVAFLLADSGRWITGTTLHVDGGYVAR